MANRENQPTVDIGMVEVALAISAVTAFMLDSHLRRPSLSDADYLSLILELFTLLFSGGAAVRLSFCYVKGKIPDLTLPKILGHLLSKGAARDAHILFLCAITLFCVTLCVWLGSVSH